MRTIRLSSLSLGGICAAANCMAWVVFFLVAPHGVIHWRFMAAAEILLSLPFLIVIPFGHMIAPTAQDVVAHWICIALNSFAWGYSLAWLLRRINRQKNRETNQPTGPR